MTEPVLRKSPLSTVVCELRFDTPAREHILELAKRFEPAGLTEYAAEEGFQLAVRPGQIEQHALRRHRFTNLDHSASATLDGNVFAFETAAYAGIDLFLEAWQPIAQAVGEVLRLEARTRIGLRYVNEIPLKAADHAAVQEAVNPSLLPPWSENEHLQALSGSLHELRFSQGEGELAFRHGLQRPGGGASPIYLLDFDHYEQRLRAYDVNDDADRLRRFNATVYDVFYWSITQEQYQSFDPEERP